MTIKGNKKREEGYDSKERQLVLYCKLLRLYVQERVTSINVNVVVQVFFFVYMSLSALLTYFLIVPSPGAGSLHKPGYSS